MSRARVNSPAGYMIQAPGVRSVAVNADVGVCFGGMVARARAVTAASPRAHGAGLVPVPACTGTVVFWYVAGYYVGSHVVARTRRGARGGRRGRVGEVTKPARRREREREHEQLHGERQERGWGVR